MSKKRGLGNTVLRNSALSVLDVGVGLVMTLGTAGIVARKLGPETMGHYGVAMWLTATMATLGVRGVGAVVQKYVAEYLGRGDIAMAKAITRAAMFVQAASAVAVAIITVFYVFLFLKPEYRLFNAIALLTAIPALLQVIPTQVNAAYEDFRANVIPGIVATLLQPLGIFLALGPANKFPGFGFGLKGLATGLMIAKLTDMSLRFYFFRGRFAEDVPKVEIPVELKRLMWRYALQTSMLLVLDLIIWERCEVFFLNRYSDIAQVSFYTSGFQLTSILLTLPTSFAWAAGATLMVQKGRDPEALNRMTSLSLRFLALIVFPLTLGMAALSGPAVKIIFSYRYLPAVPVIALMAIMSIPKGLFAPAQSLLMAMDQQKFLVKWEIVAAAFTILLDWRLIPDHGAIGAAWGNGIAQVIAVAGIWFYAIRHEKIKLPWRELSSILASAVMMAAVAYGCALYFRPWIAALVGVPAGAISYALFLRLTRGFHPDDHLRLSTLGAKLPGVLNAWYHYAITWLMQPAALESTGESAGVMLPPE